MIFLKSKKTIKDRNCPLSTTFCYQNITYFRMFWLHKQGVVFELFLSLQMQR